MTKLRDPLTVEEALDRVLGNITMPIAEAATRRSRAYLRNLSDPAKRETLTVRDMIKLDIQHARIDGTMPIHATVTAILGALKGEVFADAAMLRAHALTTVKEHSDAEIALLIAADDPEDRPKLAKALKELRESNEADAEALATVQALYDARERAPP